MGRWIDKTDKEEVISKCKVIWGAVKQEKGALKEVTLFGTGKWRRRESCAKKLFQRRGEKN